LIAEQGNTEPKRRSRGRKTAHLKKVPDTLALREELRQACRALAATLDKSRPLSRDQIEALSRELLSTRGYPEGFLGWTMVVMSSEFWRDQVAAVPPARRLFLLPHCLKHAEGCPADYDQFGLDCKTCGACSIADFRKTADEMGYKVLVAEGSPVVLKIIVSGYVDAIVGVACLNVLEKAIDKILIAGIPCMAVPLLSSDCRNTSVDEHWVEEMVATPFKTPTTTTRSYLHLLRSSARLFERERLDRIVPRVRGDGRSETLSESDPLAGVDPVAVTETIARDFLASGGKHSRPFITLATWDALSGETGTGPEGSQAIDAFPDHVFRTALSIEAFHKASLVHDDIQDDDDYRYGQEALHRKYGIPTAINVGDYLIGLGYRLVSRDAAALGSDAAAEILDLLADAHLRLSEGQGAELIWRDRRDKRLAPIDALRVYALKTAPAFEAALLAGARLAGPIGELAGPLRTFSRNLGVAFQIINDLRDWDSDHDNKLSMGSDLLGGRPTLLWALALENLDAAARDELHSLVSDPEVHPKFRVTRARQLYEQSGVFDLANRLIEKHQARAEEIADAIEPEALRRLLYYLVDTVLTKAEPPVVPTIQFSEPELRDALPIVAS
jgi:geranylgeranyl diphosphate synthase, type II